MDQFWPKGERLPIVFCNVVGREEGLSGVETDNDPHSKCNKQEAEKVVSIDHQFYNMLYYNGFHWTCLMTTPTWSNVSSITPYSAQKA